MVGLTQQLTQRLQRKCWVPTWLLLSSVFLSGMGLGVLGGMLTLILTSAAEQEQVVINAVEAATPAALPAVVQATHSSGLLVAQAAEPASDFSGIDPTWIHIPAIGVNTHVIPLALNGDGTLQVPEDFAQAGWWMRGSRPGEPGPAVIVGHFDSTSGPAVFYRLRELQPGDEIQIMDATEQAVRFKVEQLQQVPKDAFPTDVVYGRTPEPTLRLITCAGRFDQQTRQYQDNLIVFASFLNRVNPAR